MGNINIPAADVDTLDAMMDFEEAYESMLLSILNEFNLRIHNALTPNEVTAIINDCSDRILALKRFYDGIYAIINQM